MRARLWNGAQRPPYRLTYLMYYLAGLMVVGALSAAPRLAAETSPVVAVKGAATTGASGGLTFNKDIAPIMFKHCATCHRPGQSGPFPLLSYGDVKKRAKQVAEVVQKRYMPPWLPEKGVVELAEDRSLTAEEIGCVEKWVASGAREGDPMDLPPLPKWTAGWQLGTPDLIVVLPQAYDLAAEGRDVYRNFVVPIPVSERRFVKAVEFLPGNWKVVHHAFINVDSTRFSRRKAEKEKPPGFSGMQLPETVRMPAGHFLGWQPGTRAYAAPDGLAWVLEPNTDLVLQLHLQPSGKPELVQPSVGLYFTTQAPTNMAFRLNLNPLIIDIPAGKKDYVIEDEYMLPIDVDLIAVSTHAHYLGQRMEGYAEFPDGKRKELILIKNWDFKWQGDYRYEKPIFLPQGTTLHMHFTYDNSAENPHNPHRPPQRVRYGLQTTDEMGELWFQVLPRNARERNILARDFYGHLGQVTIRYNEYVLQENPNDAQAHTGVGRAQVFFGKVAEAMDHFERAIKADPKYDRAYYELGYVFLQRNQLPEAQQAFEKVVGLNPDDYEAHGSLGVIALRRGDLNGAQRHFEAALRVNPDDAIARGNLERLRKRE